jgi:GAF domain-containing protein
MAAMPTDPTVLLAVVEAQSEIASADLDLDAVMRLVCTKAEELTGADGAVVEMADGDAMVSRAASGSASAFAGLRNASHDDAVSVLSVPLVDRSGPVGALKVLSGHRRAFSERDEDTLNLLSSLIAAQMRHAQVYARAEEASREDALTGLGNARAYEERLGAEVARAIRHGRPLTVCLVELQPSDAVDSTLVRVARALCAVRACDEAFRIGPATFALLLHETSERDADVVLRRLTATLAVRDASGVPISVLTARKQARNRDVDVLQDAVGDALERARHAAGRLASAA